MMSVVEVIRTFRKAAEIRKLTKKVEKATQQAKADAKSDNQPKASPRAERSMTREEIAARFREIAEEVRELGLQLNKK